MGQDSIAYDRDCRASWSLLMRSIILLHCCVCRCVWKCVSLFVSVWYVCLHLFESSALHREERMSHRSLAEAYATKAIGHCTQKDPLISSKHARPHTSHGTVLADSHHSTPKRFNCGTHMPSQTHKPTPHTLHTQSKLTRRRLSLVCCVCSWISARNNMHSIKNP